MGRAYYRFGHDIALRLANGQAFALKDAELGAKFGAEDAPICFLRGTFTTNSYRGLMMRGVVPRNPTLQALNVPISVQMNLKPELAATVGKDAATLHVIGRRLDQNNAQDEMARRLLTLEMWQVVVVAPAGQAAQAVPVVQNVDTPVLLTPAQEVAIVDMVSELANDIWLAVEEASAEIQSPTPDEPLLMEEAVTSFFAEEAWGYEAVNEVAGLWRTRYVGQNGSWVCYTRILPDLDQVLFYSVCPVAVPASVLATMTEFLCRINADLALGNFEIDFGQLQVRFRTSIDVTDVGLSTLLFRNMVFPNLVVMDIYLPEILKVIAGGEAPILGLG